MQGDTFPQPYLGTMEVLLFGMIAEQAGTDRLTVEATSLDGLRASLLERIPGLMNGR